MNQAEAIKSLMEITGRLRDRLKTLRLMKQSAPEDMHTEIEQFISSAEETIRTLEQELSRYIGIA